MTITGKQKALFESFCFIHFLYVVFIISNSGLGSRDSIDLLLVLGSNVKSPN